MSTDGVLGAAYTPTDGQVDPARLCYALAASARAAGVTIAQRTRVTAITTRTRAGSRGVRTDRGDVECEVVVDCGGMFAPEIARLAGVRVPIVPMSHQYVVTEAFLPPGTGPLPSLRDPDLLVYYRQEVDGLVMGGYERRSAPWTATAAHVRRRARRLQRPAAGTRLGPLHRDRRERAGPGARAGRRRGPLDDQRTRGRSPRTTSSASARPRWAGSSSPRGSAPTASPGRAGSGRSWPPGSSTATRAWTCGTWTCAGSARSTARPATRSRGSSRTTRATTTSARRAASDPRAGRCGSRRPTRGTPRTVPCSARRPDGSGWSTTPAATAPASDDLRPRGWAGHGWSPWVEPEHRAAREAAALFDESSFAKIEISGPDAPAFVAHAFAGHVDAPVGRGHLHPGAGRPRRRRHGRDRDPRWRPRRSSWSPARRRAGTTWPGCATGRPGSSTTCGSPTSPGPGPASGCGVRAPATCSPR